LFYVTFIYLQNGGRIAPQVQIKEQYHIAIGGKEYFVDFRLSLADELFPALPPSCGVRRVRRPRISRPHSRRVR
jgi:hypothetical protein